MDFATNAPGYGQLQSDEVIKKLNEAYFGKGGCRDQELACYAASNADAAGENGPGNTTLSNEVCGNADDFCVSCHPVMRIPLSQLPFSVLFG